MTATAIPGLEGTLLSPRAAADWLRSGAAPVDGSPAAEWAADVAATLGPSVTERRLLEALETLCESVLGHRCRGDRRHSVAVTPNDVALALFAFPWGRPPSLLSRETLRVTLDAGAEWCVGFNGVSVAIADARPASPRRMATVALDDICTHAVTASLLPALLHARAFANGALASAIDASDRASIEVRNGLRAGVNSSLDALRRELPFDASLSVLFRMLFVLFAEARALVPVWHQTYRDHYSLASVAASGDARGTWAALEAGRRLLGDGCRAGTLQVPGFNGRLFEPGPVRKWAASARLDSRLDQPAADALTALVQYRPSRGGARRVNYAELDVEELGAIYERVLDLDPAGEGRARKESGSFYTPRSLTAFLVRRTLTPLTAGATSSAILALRVVDPAMGSGAFLVAALQFLAAALERALVREGTLHEHDITQNDRQHLRRLIAQQCLYGVDANPTAVMLAKLSLWLATLAGDKPLGFLDHRLKCGDSLIGIEPATARHAPGSSRSTLLPLFEAADAEAAVEAGAARATGLSHMSEDTLAAVRLKQRTFDDAKYRADTERWRALCDTWCAWWFTGPASRPDGREYRALADALVRRSRALGPRVLARRRRQAAELAAARRFFHWPLEFPEVFARDSPGFDAVIGNPPWEMLRAGDGSASRQPIKAFARGSGVFTLAGGGHLNLYQLFVERSLHLVRQGGRVGLVVPWGLMSDEGSTDLRRVLLDGTRIDTLARFDNHGGIFQAHRSLRFAAITTTAGSQTETFELARVDRVPALDDMPDSGRLPNAMSFTRAGLDVLSGASRRVPDARDAAQLETALKLRVSHRPLGDALGWGASFGRELNLTDDRGAFSRDGLPVLEGKHLHPYRVDCSAARHRITRSAAARLLPARPFDRPRLAYRDVTAPTNHQTLIAAIVPAGAVTSHSLFCLRNDWDLRTQHALCVVLNSAVANFLIRLFVSSHVTTSLMSWLPVPDRNQVVSSLAGVSAGDPAADERVAELYGLTRAEFEAVV